MEFLPKERLLLLFHAHTSHSTIRWNTKIRNEWNMVIKLRGVDEKDSSFSSLFILGVTINLCMDFGMEEMDHTWNTFIKSKSATYLNISSNLITLCQSNKQRVSTNTFALNLIENLG